MPAFFQKYSKTVLTLRVNETKGTSRNALIDSAYELESEKELRKDKNTFFSDLFRILDLSGNR